MWWARASVTIMQIVFQKGKIPKDVRFHFKVHISIMCRLSSLVFMSSNILRLKGILSLHRLCAGICRERSYTWSKSNVSKVKRRFWGRKMITATGNRMPPLKTASHNPVRESVASLTFFFPSALSHTIKFTSFSIPKSSSFYATARLVTSFFTCCISSLLRGSWSFRNEFRPKLC